jgi:branched-chain amino acid aminotransferase
MQLYLNGKFLNESNASVSINNRSFRYGDGFFETIKMVQGRVQFANLHWDRLFASLQALQFESPSFLTPAYLLNRIEQLVAKNGHQKLARIRVTIFRGNGGLYDPDNLHPNLLIQSWPLNPANNLLNENGLVIGDYKQGFKAADSFANLKSNNYLLYAMAALQAKRQHWNDALVLNHRGTYADATIANLWVVKENRIMTPPLTDGGVAGVARRFLLESLPAAGFSVEERSLAPNDVESADEVFLTNAIYGLRWVRQHAESVFTNATAARIHYELLQPLWR